MTSTYEFDASQVAPSQGSSPILPVSPGEGWLVTIIDAENKPTAKGDGGWYVEFTLCITEGPEKGATGAYRLNLGNDNEQTVHIAHAQLSALCYVTGVMQIADLKQLSGKPFRVIVALQKGEEAAEKGYTEIKKVLDIHGNKPGQQPAGEPATPAPSTAAPGVGNASSGSQPPPQTAQPVAPAPPTAWPSPDQAANEQAAAFNSGLQQGNGNTQQPPQQQQPTPAAASPPQGAVAPWAQPK